MPPVSPTMRGLDTETKSNKNVSKPTAGRKHERDALGPVVGDVDSDLLPERAQDVGRPGEVEGGKVFVRNALVDDGGCVSLVQMRCKVEGQSVTGNCAREGRRGRTGTNCMTSPGTPASSRILCVR